MLHMIYWMLTDGQKLAPTLLYSPLPENVVDLGKKSLSQVTYNGEVLWKYDSPIKTTETKTTEYEIPDWIRNNAKWWADGLITDQDYIKGLQYLISKGILKV